MKHCIIVKFRNDVTRAEWIGLCPEIEELFNHTLEIEGVSQVALHTNCTERDNRYDLMIEMEMTPEALPMYDACEWHHRWKDEYGHLIEKKAIFDYEGMPMERLPRSSCK